MATRLTATVETCGANREYELRWFYDSDGNGLLNDAEKEVAAYLELPPVDVREVMTFYTLFYTKPRAKTRLNICRTLACALSGADDLMKHCENKLGIQSGETTPDGKFSWQYVECLGACEIAPMLQLNDNEFVGPLTKEKIDEILDKK